MVNLPPETIRNCNLVQPNLTYLSRIEDKWGQREEQPFSSYHKLETINPQPLMRLFSSSQQRTGFSNFRITVPAIPAAKRLF